MSAVIGIQALLLEMYWINILIYKIESLGKEKKEGVLKKIGKTAWKTFGL